jgi:hypothetical protein
MANKLECNESEAAFDAKLGKLVRTEKTVCPECGHVFKGNGWDGIDAYWRGKKKGHEEVMPYEEAWPLLKQDVYSS